MKVLLVSYDLRQPGRNYVGLYQALKSADSWWHYLESTWLLYTAYDAKKWSNRAMQHIDKNDVLLVIKVTDDYAGWLPKKAWDWIREHLAKCRAIKGATR